MQDQYGQDVPSDLVVLENNWLDMLPVGVVEAIDKLDWYQYRLDDGKTTPVLASDAAIRRVSGDIIFDTASLQEHGFSVPPSAEIEHIAAVLHRYGPQAGWYHA